MNNWRFSIWLLLMFATRILWPHESVDDLMGRSLCGMVVLEVLAWQVRRDSAKKAAENETET